MSVYVDDALQDVSRRHGRTVLRAKWSHLVADGTPELVAFGLELGLRPAWIQLADTPLEHFDVTAGKRAAALRLGAIAISTEEREVLAHCRRAGAAFDLEQLRGDPSAHQARLASTGRPTRRGSGPRRVVLPEQRRTPPPPGAVLVVRPSRWANPYRPARRGTTANQAAVARFREYLARNPHLVDLAREELAGKDLACTCPPHQPCHADVWLDLVNPESPS